MLIQRSGREKEGHRNRASLLKSVSDPTRFAILEILDRSDPLPVKTICHYLGESATQPAVSHHLGVLIAARLVAAERFRQENRHAITSLGRRVLKLISDI